MADTLRELDAVYRHAIGTLAQVEWQPGDEHMSLDLLDRLYGKALNQEALQALYWVYVLTYGHTTRPNNFDERMHGVAERVQQLFLADSAYASSNPLLPTKQIDRNPHVRVHRSLFMMLRVGSDTLRVVPRKLQARLVNEPKGSPVRLKIEALQRVGRAVIDFDTAAMVLRGVLGAPDYTSSGNEWFALEDDAKTLMDWLSVPAQGERFGDHLRVMVKLLDILRTLPTFRDLSIQHVNAVFNATNDVTKAPANVPTKVTFPVFNFDGIEDV